jgi:hypothetical protein
MSGFLVAQRVEAVGRHHLAVRAVPVAAPAEVLELEAEAVGGRGEGLQDLAARGDHFLADAVTRDGGDAISLHGVLSPGEVERSREISRNLG